MKIELDNNTKVIAFLSEYAKKVTEIKNEHQFLRLTYTTADKIEGIFENEKAEG